MSQIDFGQFAAGDEMKVFQKPAALPQNDQTLNAQNVCCTNY